MKCAKLFSFFNFIFKVHPEVKIDIINYLKDELRKNNINNIRISTSDIDILNEINLSNFIIYRNSAGVIEGCLNGLLPIYYNANEEININPLYNFLEDDLIINKSDDLNIFKDTNKFKDKINLYSEIAKDYFEKINPEIVKNLIIK